MRETTDKLQASDLGVVSPTHKLQFELTGTPLFSVAVGATRLGLAAVTSDARWGLRGPPRSTQTFPPLLIDLGDLRLLE